MTHANVLTVGIGSPHGDDQAGWLVAERLAADPQHHRIAIRQAASPAELLDWLDGVDCLIVCDACRGLGRVGALRRWTWPARALADASWSGSHDFSLTTALQLAERLGRLPPRVVIWSVEAAAGKAFGAPSPEVAAALPRLVARLTDEIGCCALSRDEPCTNSPS